MSILKYTIVDTFTSLAFSGNPGAVIVLEGDQNPLSDEQMQQIAAEFNLSATAFIVPSFNSSNFQVVTYSLRWFTPTKEIKLCGHGTLAGAKILFEELASSISTLQFKTLSGILEARRTMGDGKIELEFPSAPLSDIGTDELTIVSDLLRKAVEGSIDIRAAQKAWGYLLVHIAENFDLEGADIDTRHFSVLKDYNLVILTSARPSTLAPSAKFISRVFVPNSDTPEDPVTGSAHCLLAPYWSSILGIKGGEVIPARQASKRGGDIDLVWVEKANTVKIRGDAVVVARGELCMYRDI